MKKFISALPIALAMTSCILFAARDTTLNYETEGFINEDTFQVIIRESPDLNMQGLVSRRENSLGKAKDGIKKGVMNAIVNYCIDNYIKVNSLKIGNLKEITNISDIKKNLQKRVENYYRKGYISFELYGEDQSVAVGYRITNTDLKKEIESITFEYK